MDKVIEFVSNNYIWFIVVGGVLIVTALLLLFVKKEPVKEEKVEEPNKPEENIEEILEEEIEKEEKYIMGKPPRAKEKKIKYRNSRCNSPPQKKIVCIIHLSRCNPPHKKIYYFVIPLC